MNLRNLIDHYFGGNAQSFTEAVGVSTKTTYRWQTGGAVVANGKICLPQRDLPTLPVMPPPLKREQFEAMLTQRRPTADLSSVNGVYLDTQVQAIWEGWYMAQCAMTNEALNRQ
ncbi:hypothetical protein ABNO07_003628 [Salmonella enterica subsp. enterica serovar Bareilly]